MLGALRGVARTPIALVFIFLLAASFAVWGLSDVFVGRSSGAMAVAGKRHVYQYDLERRVGYYLQNQRAEGQFTDRRKATEDGTIKQIFDAMTENLSLLDHADNTGVGATRRGIAERIAGSGGFADPVTGEFARESYRQFLDRTGETRAGFEAALRDDLTLEYLGDLSELAISPPENLIRIWSLPFLEKRSFAYAIVPEPVEIPEPSEEEIETYYADNPSPYAVPERRELAVLSLSADDYLHTIEISEDDIARAYERNGEDHAGPEKREIIEASSITRRQLELLADRVNTGTDPEDAFDGLDQVIQSIRTVSEDKTGDDEMLEAAFNAPENRAFSPYQDENTGLWTTLVVKTVIPGEIPPLDEIREKLERDIERKRAEEAFATDRSESLIDLIGGGYAADLIATEIGGVVTSYPAVSRAGKTADGMTLEALGEDIREAAFALADGETSAEIETENGISVVQVLGIESAGKMPLDAVRDEIRIAIVEETRKDAARVAAEAIASQASDLESFRTAAGDAGLLIRTFGEEISRFGREGGLDSSVSEAVFALSPDEASVIGRPTGAALVLWLTEVALNNDKDTVEQYFQAGKTALPGILGSDIGSAARAFVRRRTPVRIDNRAFEDFTNVLLGQANPG